MDLCCDREQQRLFAHLSFEITAGSLLLIEGPNGVGKSTLLQLLAGLITPSSGEIHWQNIAIQQQRESYAREIHYIGHTNGIKLGLTVLENLQLASHLALASIASERLSETLSRLQLENQRTKLAKQLSAGQKRRLALARLLLFRKPLWILDEPLTSLDAATQAMVMQLLEAHVNDGGICVMSSHQSIPFKEIEIKTLRLTAC